MARVKILHPFNLQFENGVSLQFFAGGEYVPDEHMGHPLVLANIERPGPEVVSDVPAPSVIEMPILESPEELVRDAELVSEGVTKDGLIEEAKSLGIAVDGRWGMARIQAEIEKALAE